MQAHRIKEGDLDTKKSKQLQEADWGELGKKLMAFAVYRASRYKWRSGSIDDLSGNATLKDIVQSVILKTLDGSRDWDPNKGELEPWLMDQVKSEIDALAKSASHRREMSLPQEEDGDDAVNRIEQQAVEHGILGNPRPLAPETAILKQEAVIQRDRKINAIFQAVEGKEDLENLLNAIMDGCEPKPRYLAECLNTPVKEIYNQMKRLRRYALDIMRRLDE